ncbi:hypothetical protein NLG97_g9838 [Lecanicillium saksenae]|uniref:Uncharacterized protein n=1 Tax=Lecanicillium saksenae TaxID=468837 RepID=A0ACC1QEW4_9HYPO|nr:hypothetical protein NLG97_g9838 [Lecanicillium saksenae]
MAPMSNSMSSSGTPHRPHRCRPSATLSTSAASEQVREARRKFQEREKAKDEKYARQQLRRRERADQNRDRAKIRKSTTGSTSTAKSSATSSRYAASQATEDSSQEKFDFGNTGSYDHTAAGQTPARADEVQFQRPKRRKTAKHKTNGVFTAFMLWLRTRLLRLGKH